LYQISFDAVKSFRLFGYRILIQRTVSGHNVMDFKALAIIASNQVLNRKHNKHDLERLPFFKITHY
jgi:hypothetical protein